MAAPDLPPPPAVPARSESAEANPHIRLRSGANLPAPTAAPARGPEAVAAPAKKSGPARDSLGVFVRVAGLLLILTVAYLAYRRYSQIPHPEKPEPAVAASTTTAAKSAPGGSKSAPGSMPGRLVQKARDTVAAADGVTAATNEVMDLPAAPAAQPAPAATAATAPAVKAAPPPPPAPSPRFRAMIDRLKISGFRAGPPARLFVGGVTYQPGDTIDEGLGIVFTGFDAKAGDLIFKDGTGAEIRRHF